MSTALARVKTARTQLDDAKNALQVNAKSAINETLKAVFADETVQSVAWSQKNSEYNDEGMYPGFHGPVLNDAPVEDIRDWAYDSQWLFGYDRAEVDPKLAELKDVLEAVGEEILVELYDDEAVVVAQRRGDKLVIQVESVGY